MSSFYKKLCLAAFAAVLTVFAATGCGNEGGASESSGGISWQSLSFDREMKLDYAEQFSVSYCGDDYKYITIGDDQKILLVAEGAEIPQGLDADITVLKAPLDNIYLVATAAMDYFRQLDGIDKITLSSQKADSWYIDEAREAMESGEMQYAGKYSTPDYELILAQGCDLAIENTMIYHSPEVVEKLENLGIPVVVERSSYESEPLGRMEWIKLYGALIGKEEEAEDYYRQIMDELDGVIGKESTGKTVAFFSINTSNSVNVRKSGDYVAKCIEMSGGKYISFDESNEENSMSTMNIQEEVFYAGAKDADVIIYNSTIEGELQTIDQLLEKSAVLGDFKAVKNGNVWCIEKNFYQESLELGELMLDINKVLTRGMPDESELYFLHRLK